MLLWGLTCAECLSAMVWADEKLSVRPIDLVGDDVALICEIDQPKSEWAKLRQSELFRRVAQAPIYQHWLTSQALRHWQDVEQKAVDRTGTALSEQLLNLCGQELILAMYLSADNCPEGILLTRGESSEAPARLLQTWQQLEPMTAVESLKHQGREYFCRKKPGSQGNTLFYAVHGDVFVLSDHESRVRQAIERLPGDGNRPGVNTAEAIRFVGKPASQPGIPIRVYLPARAWDRVWQNIPKSDQGGLLLSRWWPAIDAVTAEIRLDEGIAAQLQVQLNADKTDADWRSWCAVTANPREFLASVPADAFLVAAGCINAGPLFNLIQDLTSDRDRAEWQKTRRIARGLLGGHDPLDEVLPALGEQVSLYLLRRPSREGDLPIDGVLTCRFSPAAAAAGLHLALDPALSAGLVLLSADCAEKFAGDEPPVVRSELSEGRATRWLETSNPIRLAYQLTSQSLTVARSIEVLRQHLADETGRETPSRFQQLAEARFPEAEQFLCVDVRRFREGQRQESSGSGSTPRFQSWKPWLELCDTAYLATRFEPARATIDFGLLAEPQ